MANLNEKLEIGKKYKIVGKTKEYSNGEVFTLVEKKSFDEEGEIYNIYFAKKNGEEELTSIRTIPHFNISQVLGNEVHLNLDNIKIFSDKLHPTKGYELKLYNNYKKIIEKGEK